MLLLDALYINKGGGKILLDLLIKKLIKENIPVFFLLDKRVEHKYPQLKDHHVQYVEANLIKRHFFYLKNRHRFTSVLAFANIPPSIHLNCKVYTFFQNVLLVNDDRKFNLSSVFSLLKEFIIRSVHKNSDYWIVQSSLVKNLLINNWGISQDIIYVLPLYDDQKMENAEKKTNVINTDSIKFLYVSTGEPHKNHINLLNAFSEYNRLFPASSLTLTIGEEYYDLCKVIEQLHEEGIAVVNKKFLSMELLEMEYKNADVFIFPSLKESFGLGLIEATQYGLPIIASDLPFVKEVIIPSAVFSPNSKEKILSVLLDHKNYINVPGKIVAQNKIGDMINMLISKN